MVFHGTSKLVAYYSYPNIILQNIIQHQTSNKKKQEMWEPPAWPTAFQAREGQQGDYHNPQGSGSPRSKVRRCFVTESCILHFDAE